MRYDVNTITDLRIRKEAMEEYEIAVNLDQESLWIRKYFPQNKTSLDKVADIFNNNNELLKLMLSRNGLASNLSKKDTV